MQDTAHIVHDESESKTRLKIVDCDIHPSPAQAGRSLRVSAQALAEAS